MRLRNTAFAAASGLLLATTFPEVDFHLLAWISLIPLFLALEKQTVKNGFWLGGLFGIIFFAATVHWVTNSVHFYGGIPLIPASLVTLLLCAFLALYPAPFGAVKHGQGSRKEIPLAHAPQLFQPPVGDDGMPQLERVRVLRSLFQDVSFTSNIGIQRHHQIFAN